MTRDQLFVALRAAGTPISPTQLLRWTHSRWVRPPIIKGRGHARGVKANYPFISLLQCHILACLMDVPRMRLNEAGWYLWAIGVGEPARARDFLREHLTARLEAAELFSNPGRQRRAVERALRLAAREPTLASFRKVMGQTRLVGAIRFMMEAEAGRHPSTSEAFAEEDADAFQATAIETHWGPMRDALRRARLPEEPPPRALLPEAAIGPLLSTKLPLQPILDAVTTWPDDCLLGMAYEAQMLLEEASGQRLLLTPDAYVNHIRASLDPKLRIALMATRRARGWTAPPPAAVLRWPEFAALQQPKLVSPGESHAPTE